MIPGDPLEKDNPDELIDPLVEQLEARQYELSDFDQSSRSGGIDMDVSLYSTKDAPGDTVESVDDVTEIAPPPFQDEAISSPHMANEPEEEQIYLGEDFNSLQSPPGGIISDQQELVDITSLVDNEGLDTPHTHDNETISFDPTNNDNLLPEPDDSHLGSKPDYHVDPMQAVASTVGINDEPIEDVIPADSSTVEPEADHSNDAHSDETATVAPDDRNDPIESIPNVGGRDNDVVERTLESRRDRITRYRNGDIPSLVRPSIRKERTATQTRKLRIGL